MSAWRYLSFDEAVEDVSGGNVKTKQNDYADEGAFAIVDQGKALVAGYTDDAAALCKASLPVVIFGDHTRCLKYVDFPFGMGADGVKVLRPRVDLDVKFLYHYLRQLKLPDGGYDRHFKYLKRESVPVPSLAKQRRIATILDQAETLRAQHRAALTQLDSLTQSIFLDMFGDPLDIPKRWTWVRMSELFETSPIFGTMIPGDADSGSWLCLRVANIQDWQLTLDDRKYVDLPESAVKRHSVKAGDLLMARAIASQDHLGKCIVAQPGDEQWAFDSHLMRLRFRADQALPDFIRQMLRTPGGRKLFLKASRKSSVQYNINTKEISALEIPVPPLPLQQTFATRIQAIAALKATHRAALVELDALFASLQHRAFSGELTQSTSPVQVLHIKARDFSELSRLDADKGLEALIYVARRMPEHHFYKSLKALYFADKHQLEHQGRLIYGETHCALPMGPVPQAAYDAAKVLSGELLVSAFDDEALHASLRRMDRALIPLRDADPAKLSAEERASLDWAIRYVAPMSFDQVKTASHDSAYERTPRNMPIQLEHIVEMFSDAAKRKFFLALS